MAVDPGLARLVVIAGPEVGLVFSIGPRPQTIGRSIGADICVQGEGVSRRHARVSRTSDGGVVVQDLGSANGTFLNDARVDQALISSGDHLRIGLDVVLQLECDGPDERDTVDLPVAPA